jgi:isoleucyl-tRNA synthetase
MRGLEAARNEKTIKANLEASVILYLLDDEYNLLSRYGDKLAAFFVVSKVEIRQGPLPISKYLATPRAIEVTKAEGEKCERCWNYSTHVGEDATYPTVCERCSANLRTIVGEGAAHE